MTDYIAIVLAIGSLILWGPALLGWMAWVMWNLASIANLVRIELIDTIGE